MGPRGSSGMGDGEGQSAAETIGRSKIEGCAVQLGPRGVSPDVSGIEEAEPQEGRSYEPPVDLRLADGDAENPSSRYR